MGLKKSTAYIFLLSFMATPFNTCSAADSAVLEKKQWPEVMNCEVCVPIQFGKLEMLLPLTEIGKILVVNSEASALHILPKTNDPLAGVLFLSVESKNLLGKYQELGFLSGQDIATNEQLFDALGQPSAKKTSLSTIRRIEHIDEAESYVKTSKGSLHVYWIQSALPNSQYVYFFIDGQEAAYLLAGNVTPNFYEAVLSNIRIVNIP